MKREEEEIDNCTFGGGDYPVKQIADIEVLGYQGLDSLVLRDLWSSGATLTTLHGKLFW